MEKRKIGIIGGMGPAATWLFYKYVTEMTEVSRDQDHVNLVIMSDAAMPDRTDAILAEEYDPVMKKMREDLAALENCGCAAVAVTCNTAHFFLDRLAGEIHVPVIHMLEETAKAAEKRVPGGKVGILATRGTVRTGLYQRRLEAHGMEPFVPSEEIEEIVMGQIYGRVKRGLPSEPEVWEQIGRYLQDHACGCAVMGCTELSVVKEELALGGYYMDPMRILARRVIAFGGGKLREEWHEE